MAKKHNRYSRPDAFTRDAKASGYPARSVHKLKEIDQRIRLLRKNDSVLDLGAAPGSWSIYAAQRVGPGGSVLAIDLSEITAKTPAHMTVVQGDALDLDSETLQRHGPYNVVLSDMAPKTSGAKELDQARSFELFTAALQVARTFGVAGSHFAAKLFMSEDFVHARKAVQEAYTSCKVIRPKSVRQVSSELFIVGVGLRESAQIQARPTRPETELRGSTPEESESSGN